MGDSNEQFEDAYTEEEEVDVTLSSWKECGLLTKLLAADNGAIGLKTNTSCSTDSVSSAYSSSNPSIESRLFCARSGMNIILHRGRAANELFLKSLPAQFRSRRFFSSSYLSIIVSAVDCGDAISGDGVSTGEANTCHSLGSRHQAGMRRE